MLDLSRLTGRQREAVLAPRGPLLLLAGPGTGKTTVLAARMGYEVSVRELAPASILAITFTRAAGRALRERIGGILGRQARELDITTFHAFGWRVVQQWWQELGYASQQLVVYGRSDAEWLLERAAGELGLELRQYRLADLLRLVDTFRLSGLCATDRLPLADLAKGLEARLRERNAVDFTAMLALPLRLLQHDDRALRLYRDAYRAILVDEFQDVSPEQYQLLRLLAQDHRNLMAAGDASQALFGWRGADAQLMARFPEDFPGARAIELTENQRATALLVAASNALGARLANPSVLTPLNPAGLAPVLYAAADEQAEAAFVAVEIERLAAADEIGQLADVAVLYRTNQQAIEVTLALRARGIPFQMRGGGDLLARREVQAAIAYLRLADNPEDGLALARIVNIPPRGLGPVASVLIEEPVAIDRLVEVAGRFGQAAAHGAGQLMQLLLELHGARDEPPARLLDLVVARTGLGAWLQRQPGGREALGNLDELRRMLARCDQDLASWLADIAGGELLDARSRPDEVVLATIHAAKGEEFPVVFALGLEETILPHYRAVLDAAGNPDALDEELRVAYVALTRARTRLYLSYCRQRRRDQQLEPRQPSRFLGYLAPDLLGAPARGGAAAQRVSHPGRPLIQKFGR